MFKLPFQLPPYSGAEDDPRLATEMQAPPIFRVHVQPSEQWNPSLGDDIRIAVEAELERADPLLRHFVMAQRQNRSLGVAQFQGGAVQLTAAVRALYSNNQGTEILNVIVTPRNTGGGQPMSAETNTDGYVFWKQASISRAPDATFEFMLNNQTLYTLSGTTGRRNIGVLFRFGKTATLCHSLIDKTKDQPDLPGNPGKLVLELLPPRGQMAAFKNVYGIDIPSYPDLFGYFMFDEWHLLNNAGQPDIDSNGEPNPEIIHTVDVADPGKVLNETGNNEFRVKVTPATALQSDSGGSFTMQAEFYSRHYFRSVVQTWSRRNVRAKVNDKPLHFGMVTGLYPVQAMDIDLTAQAIPDDAAQSTEKVHIPQPTKINPPTAYLPDPDAAGPGKLVQWDDDTIGRGYWRLGDPMSLQSAPPNSPWYTAVSLAHEVLENIQRVAILIASSKAPCDPSLSFANPTVAYALQNRKTNPQSIYETLSGHAYFTYNVVGVDILNRPTLTAVFKTNAPQINGEKQNVVMGNVIPWGALYPYTPTNEEISYTVVTSTSTEDNVAAWNKMQQLNAMWQPALDRYNTATTNVTSVDIYDADGGALMSAQQSKNDLDKIKQIADYFFNGGTYQVVVHDVYYGLVQTYEWAPGGDYILPAYGFHETMTQVGEDGSAVAHTIPWGCLSTIQTDAQAPEDTNVVSPVAGKPDINAPGASYFAALVEDNTCISIYEGLVFTAKNAETQIQALQYLLAAMDAYKSP